MTENRPQGNFYSNGVVTSLAFSTTGKSLAIGDAGGNIYNLALKGFTPQAVIVTASNHWPKIGVVCPFCHSDFTVKKERLGTEITCLKEGCKARLKLNAFVIQRPLKSRNL